MQMLGQNKVAYLPLPPDCWPEPRPLAGMGYGKGAYGRVYDGLPEVAPAVEVLPGEEEVEDIVDVEVGVLTGTWGVFGCGEVEPVMTISGVELEVGGGCSAVD